MHLSEKTVYNAYEPKYYTRREDMGGLVDKRNMNSTLNGNTLTVKNIAPLDNGSTDYELDDIVVNGLGNMPFPRDFYSETENRLAATGECAAALKQGMKNRGYNVK